MDNVISYARNSSFVRNDDCYRATASEFIEYLITVDTGDVSAQKLLTGILSSCYSTDAAGLHASVLLAHFNSLNAVLRSRWDQVVRLTNLSHDAWLQLQIARLATIITLREPVEKRPCFSSNRDVHDYLRLSIGQDTTESIRVLFLDAKNNLIKDEKHSSGNTKYVPFRPRDFIIRVAELAATAVIVVHNHPSGDVQPSDEDKIMTEAVIELLGHLGVRLHDHLIVSRTGCFSFRQAGLID